MEETGDDSDEGSITSNTYSKDYLTRSFGKSDDCVDDEDRHEDDRDLDDDIVVVHDEVCIEVGTPKQWSPKLYIFQKVANMKRISKVWEYYADLCEDQHSKLDNRQNMKVCLACRSKRRDKIVSMGGRERNNATSAKLVNHLQNVHLSDGQYKAYLVMEKDIVAMKCGKQQPSYIEQAYIT
jgi:hypothetical protein